MWARRSTKSSDRLGRPRRRRARHAHPARRRVVPPPAPTAPPAYDAPTVPFHAMQSSSDGRCRRSTAAAAAGSARRSCVGSGGSACRTDAARADSERVDRSTSTARRRGAIPRTPPLNAQITPGRPLLPPRATPTSTSARPTFPPRPPRRRQVHRRRHCCQGHRLVLAEYRRARLRRRQPADVRRTRRCRR